MTQPTGARLERRLWAFGTDDLLHRHDPGGWAQCTRELGARGTKAYRNPASGTREIKLCPKCVRL